MKTPFLIALSLLTAAGCSHRTTPEVEASSKAAPPLAVRLARAETRTIERNISVTGSLLPDESVNLSFEIPGTLATVFTDFGRMVRKGDVLAELDQREITLQLERSRAALAQALARVGLSPDQADTSP